MGNPKCLGALGARGAWGLGARGGGLVVPLMKSNRLCSSGSGFRDV